MKEYKLAIANIKLLIRLSSNFDLSYECKCFSSSFKTSDYIINVYNCKKFNDSFFINDEIYKDDKNYIKVFSKGNHYFKIKYDINFKEILWILKFNKGNNIYNLFINNKNLLFLNIFDYLEISEFFSKNNALLLHSSAIEYNDFCVVFTAPSGVGKSTQASLWKKYLNSPIMNGDKTIISCENTKFIAYGSPIAGTSHIFEKRFAPISIIVILKQAKVNNLYLVNSKQALMNILSQVSMCEWDKNIIDKQLSLISNLISNIPVYCLECLPDSSAVYMLKNEIDKLIS